MLGLGEGQLASHPGQNDRFRISIGQARASTIGTLGRPLLLLAASDKFTLGERPGDFIADLTRQFFQVNERPSSRQLLLVLPSQRLRDSLNPVL
jgi:hypothetical protein